MLKVSVCVAVQINLLPQVARFRRRLIPGLPATLPRRVWPDRPAARTCAKSTPLLCPRYPDYSQAASSCQRWPNHCVFEPWPIWAVDAGGLVIVGYQGAQQKPKRSPKGKSALPTFSRTSQVVAELIPLEFEGKPPKRRAAPASTVIEGRTGRAVFSVGLVVLSPHSGLTN